MTEAFWINPMAAILDGAALSQEYTVKNSSQSKRPVEVCVHVLGLQWNSLNSLPNVYQGLHWGRRLARSHEDDWFVARLPRFAENGKGDI